ncbi:MAG: hypothetical protein KIS73_29250, partial [Enhydrobacter sp.]|nr:hypothetical protein [Enhydrobacter sp.]
VGNELANTLIGGWFGDSLSGGAGDDSLNGHYGDDTLMGDDGNDRLIGYSGADYLYGGDGDDTLTDFGWSLVDTLDILEGGAGNDTLHAIGKNPDAASYASATGGVTVDLAIASPQDTLGAGVDTLIDIENLIGSAWADILLGNDGANVLTGLDGNDTLRGGAGNDTLDGGAGEDELMGGAGNDVYIVDSLADTISEETVPGIDDGGTDRVEVAFSFTLGAFLENLTLTGADAINGTGNELANVIVGNGAANVLTGGAGDDTYWIDSPLDQVIEAAGEGIDTVQVTTDWTMAAGQEIESVRVSSNAVPALTLVGNELANTITGGWNDDTLSGGAGDDSLNGNDGNDTVDGGDGNDMISTSSGTDNLNGGAGNDTFLIFDESYYWLDSGTIDGGAGTDTLRLHGWSSRLADFATTATEVLDFYRGFVVTATAAQLASFASIVNSYSGPRELEFGLTGAGGVVDFSSRISGGDSARVYAAEGLTQGYTVTGTVNNDHMEGSAYDDNLDGVAGQDELTGGAGDDTFLVAKLGDSTTSAPDLITDFAAGDVIDLHAIDADLTVRGNQEFHLGATPGHTGDIVVTFDASRSRTVVDLYVDGDAVADARLWLTGDHGGLTAADFVL